MIKLKGGSLSSTYLMENEKGKFIRKMVNTKEAYFDLEYLKTYKDIKTIFTERELSEKELQ